MVFHWSLSDSKSHQVSRTLRSILVDLNNAVAWIVSTHTPTSKSSGPFNNPSFTVPNGPIKIGTIVTFMFYRFLDSLATYWCISFFSLSFSFIRWSAGTVKSTFCKLSLFRWLLWSITLYSLDFLHQRLLMVFHCSLSDSKSPQVSRTLLSILAVLNNVVVWMVSTRPPTSKSSSPFSNPIVTVPNTLFTITIIVTCMFHSFFNSLARSRYLYFFSHSFSFIL